MLVHAKSIIFFPDEKSQKEAAATAAAMFKCAPANYAQKLCAVRMRSAIPRNLLNTREDDLVNTDENN